MDELQIKLDLDVSMESSMDLGVGFCTTTMINEESQLPRDLDMEEEEEDLSEIDQSVFFIGSTMPPPMSSRFREEDEFKVPEYIN